MEVRAELVTRVSKKGNTYTAIEIYLTDNLKKLVFLTDAELELLKITTSSNYKK